MVARSHNTRETRICVAQIGAAHGLKGEVRLWSFTGDPQAVAAYGPLESEDGARSFRILHLRAEKDHFVARLEGVADRDAADALRNINLYAHRAALPDTHDPDTFYHADLIGLAAFDPNGNPLGEVVALHNFGAGDIIELRVCDGETKMYPFTKAVVPEIDLAGGRLILDPPVESGDEAEEKSARVDARRTGES